MLMDSHTQNAVLGARKVAMVRGSSMSVRIVFRAEIGEAM